MKKTKFTEEKIIGAVKQMESSRAVKEIARELGVTDQTLYNWKSKYGHFSLLSRSWELQLSTWAALRRMLLSLD